MDSLFQASLTASDDAGPVDGGIVPPRQPPRFCPMNAAVFTPITPGTHCESANTSMSSSGVTHARCSTISRVKSGSMVYPLPNMSEPIFKNETYSSQIVFIQACSRTRFPYERFRSIDIPLVHIGQ